MTNLSYNNFLQGVWQTGPSTIQHKNKKKNEGKAHFKPS